MTPLESLLLRSSSGRSKEAGPVEDEIQPETKHRRFVSGSSAGPGVWVPPERRLALAKDNGDEPFAGQIKSRSATCDEPPPADGLANLRLAPIHRLALHLATPACIVIGVTQRILFRSIAPSSGKDIFRRGKLRSTQREKGCDDIALG